MIEQLIAIILVMYTASSPSGIAAEKTASYRAGVEALAPIIVEVGSQGLLVSPEVDPAMLAAVAWYESTFRPDSPDGDCHRIGLSPDTTTMCTATGPMQVVKSAGSYLGAVEPSLKDIRADALRDPKTSVRAGYAALRLWKKLCGGSPAVWLTAYVWGHCPRSPDWEGVRRCALATAMLDKLGHKPADWACGHEKRAVESHTRFLVRKIKKATLPCSSALAYSPSTESLATSSTR